jgi:hypothetical protein
MEEVDELLNGGDSVQTTETTVTKETVSPDKPVEINGRTYTQAEFAEMAKDYENLAKQQGKLANEVGELRKKVTPAKEVVETKANPDDQLTPEQIAQGKKELKEKFGVVTEEDLDRRDYTKAADAEINRIVKKYGIDAEKFGEELVDIGVRMNPEKFEKIWIANHTDDYLKWKKEAMKKDTPETPYTVRPVKEGLELPVEAKPRFGETVVSKALELIGATDGANT